jgi:hypothetical protein
LLEGLEARLIRSDENPSKDVADATEYIQRMTRRNFYIPMLIDY